MTRRLSRSLVLLAAGAARADLDMDFMRNNPHWAPTVHLQRRALVSRSTGCVVVHPVYGFDIAAACKR